MNKRKWRTKKADGDTVQLKVTSAEQIVQKYGPPDALELLSEIPETELKNSQ